MKLKICKFFKLLCAYFLFLADTYRECDIVCNNMVYFRVDSLHLEHITYSVVSWEGYARILSNFSFWWDHLFSTMNKV